MVSIPELLDSARAELSAETLWRWASVFFSLSVLSFQISLAASQIFLAVAAAFYVLRLIRERRVPEFPPVKLPWALFCLLTVLSALWARDPTAGWLAVRKLVLFSIWLLALNLVTGAAQLKFLYQVLFMESAMTGIVAITQFVIQYRAVRALHPNQVYVYMTAERVHGLMGHWMNFGGQQMLVFGALLSFLLLSGRPRRVWWVVAGVAAVSLIVNFTRGVWLGCSVAAVYLIGRAKRRWLALVPIVLVAGYLAAPGLIRHRLEVLRHPSSDPSLSLRFEMWRVALRMMNAHPFLGVGPNNINEVYERYLPRGKMPVIGYREHLHSNFLEIGAERGIPCLAAWVWMMVALSWKMLQVRRRLLGKGRPTWVADAALAAWLALMVEGFFEFNFGTSPVLMMFLFISSTPWIIGRAEVTRGAASATIGGPDSAIEN